MSIFYNSLVIDLICAWDNFLYLKLTFLFFIDKLKKIFSSFFLFSGFFQDETVHQRLSHCSATKLVIIICIPIKNFHLLIENNNYLENKNPNYPQFFQNWRLTKFTLFQPTCGRGEFLVFILRHCPLSNLNP